MPKVQIGNNDQTFKNLAAVGQAKCLTCCLVIVIVFFQESIAQDRNIELSAVYTADNWWNTAGGIDTGTRYLSNIDLQLDAPLFGGTLFLYGLHTNNAVLSEDLVGDLQVISNIDSTNVSRMYEAWYYHDLGTDAATIKAGLIDLNSEFDAIEPAGLFINSSHGIGPDFSQTGENGPSIFPSTSLGLELEFIPEDLWHVHLGIFDAVPNDPEDPNSEKISLREGALILGEVNYMPHEGLRYAIAAWGYSHKFETIENPGVKEDGNWGVYAFVSGNLYTAEDDTGLSAWLRYGFADNTDINPLKSYLGLGFVYTGLFVGRPGDQLGLAIGTAFIGDTAKQAARLAGDPVKSSEINLELTYRAEITNWLTIQPDVQYVINPGIVGGLDNALVVGLRIELSFGHDFDLKPAPSPL